MVNKKYTLFFISLIIVVLTPYVLAAPIQADYQIIDASVLVEINFLK